MKKDRVISVLFCSRVAKIPTLVMFVSAYVCQLFHKNSGAGTFSRKTWRRFFSRLIYLHSTGWRLGVEDSESPSDLLETLDCLLS